MASKTLKTNTTLGFSIVEMVIVLAMIMVLSTLMVSFINPSEQNKKARDEKRFSDISKLERVISEYRIDKGYLPDEEMILRTSTSLPTGSSGPLAMSNGTGWLPGDLSRYTTSLPLDPKNDSTYFYSYRNNEYSFELNAVLEYFTDHSENDGGNDPGVYEVGDDLSVI